MNAKTLLLSTTALTLASTGMLVGAIPVAHAADAVKPLGYSVDPVSGYVEAYGAFGQMNKSFSGGPSDSTGLTVVGGAGRLNWWVSPTMTLQVDAYGNGINKDNSVPTAMAIAGHVGWRGMSSANLAVMGSIGSAQQDRLTTLAVEGQLHGSNWTLYGQAGLVSPQSYTGRNVPYVALQGRYFFNQNFEAVADVTFASGPTNSSAPLNGSLSRFGAELDYKPMGMPISLFGRGQIQTVSESSYKQTDTEALFGIKLFVNQPSLWSNDINGATYLDLNPIYGEFATKHVN